MRKTKIVCTMGPSTDKPGILRQLMENGMNVARFNFSTYSYTLANLSGIILQVRRGRQEENSFRLKKTAQKLFPCSPLIFTQFQLVQCKFCHSPGTA